MHRRWDKSKPPRGPFTLNKDCPQAIGLQAWYPMGSTSVLGYAVDNVFNNHLTGTASGMAMGDAGQPAMGFAAASSQYISAVGIWVTNYPLSIVAWVMPASAENHSIACVSSSNGAAGAGRKELYLSSTYKINAYDQSLTGSGAATTTVGGALNMWLHGAAVFAGQASRVAYINGANAVSNSTDAGAWHAGPNRQVGGDGAGLFMNGHIGEVGLYSIALPADIVWRLYDPSTRFELWYPLRSRKWISAPATFKASWAVASNTVIQPGALTA